VTEEHDDNQGGKLPIERHALQEGERDREAIDEGDADREPNEGHHPWLAVLELTESSLDEDSAAV
jgi:hypothetical protein